MPGKGSSQVFAANGATLVLIRLLLLQLLLRVSLFLSFGGTITAITAATITKEIALSTNDNNDYDTGGYDIPIMIVTPNTTRKNSQTTTSSYPVVYHVHGGGWNGGTTTQVPTANVLNGLRFLTDQLDVIHVGLAYRCKLQNGTFDKALEDVRQSVKWFEKNRATQYNADLNRVGFSAGSAGTPFAALMAYNQEEISTSSFSSKTFVGFYGLYDLLNNTQSLFPSDEAYREYGIHRDDQKRSASVIYNLRRAESPALPATLLFHGQLDILIHPTQSTRFEQHLLDQGTVFAEATIYSAVSHGWFNKRMPDLYSDAMKRIAQHYVQYLGANANGLTDLEEALENDVAPYRPKQTIDDPAVLIGYYWVGITKGQVGVTYQFMDEVNGMHTHPSKEQEGIIIEEPFAYIVIKEEGIIAVVVHQGDQYDSLVVTFRMLMDEDQIYFMEKNNERYLGKRYFFVKQANYQHPPSVPRPSPSPSPDVTASPSSKPIISSPEMPTTTSPATTTTSTTEAPIPIPTPPTTSSPGTSMPSWMTVLPRTTAPTSTVMDPQGNFLDQTGAPPTAATAMPGSTTTATTAVSKTNSPTLKPLVGDAGFPETSLVYNRGGADRRGPELLSLSMMTILVLSTWIGG